MNYFRKIMLYWYLKIFGHVRVFDYKQAIEFLNKEAMQLESFVVVIPNGPSLYVKEYNLWKCDEDALLQFSVKNHTRFKPYFVARWNETFEHMNRNCYVEYYLDDNNQIQQKSVFESTFSFP